MTTEQLANANILTSQIDELRKHYAIVKKLLDAEPESFQITMTHKGYDARYLNDNFMPISKNDLVKLYLGKIEAKIKLLEEQFAAI